jgi:hypothetical protein
VTTPFIPRIPAASLFLLLLLASQAQAADWRQVGVLRDPASGLLASRIAVCGDRVLYAHFGPDATGRQWIMGSRNPDDPASWSPAMTLRGTAPYAPAAMACSDGLYPVLYYPPVLGWIGLDGGWNVMSQPSGLAGIAIADHGEFPPIYAIWGDATLRRNDAQGQGAWQSLGSTARFVRIAGAPDGALFGFSVVDTPARLVLMRNLRGGQESAWEELAPVAHGIELAAWSRTRIYTLDGDGRLWRADP